MSCLPEALPNDKKEEITANSTLWREILLALNGYNKSGGRIFYVNQPTY